MTTLMTTLTESLASAAPPPAADPKTATAPSLLGGLRSPRIYYLHPLLAGDIANWAAHFDRIAGLGFDHVLMGPVFRPGRTGSILLAADHERLHPALAWEG